jgi:hypothetical protein
MKINVSSTLFCCTSSVDLDIPVENWNEVKDWYVKWDALHYTLDGERWHEVDLCSSSDDIIDWKRPLGATVRSPDFTEEYDSFGE